MLGNWTALQYVPNKGIMSMVKCVPVFYYNSKKEEGPVAAEKVHGHHQPHRFGNKVRGKGKWERDWRSELFTVPSHLWR